MNWGTMIESSSCDLFSHPGKKLHDHLSAVADYCETTHHSAQPEFSSLGYSHDILAVFSRTLGACHDFGKATSFFQEYLFADDKKRPILKAKPETRHGLVSAIFTYYCLQESLKNKPGMTNSLLPFVGFILVRRHHGNLINFYDEIADIRKTEKTDLIKRQCKAINRDSLESSYCNLIPKEVINGFFVEIETTLAAIVRDGNIFRLKPRLTEIPDAPAMEIFTLFYYSLLLDGDKRDAAEISADRTNYPIPPDLVDTYRHIHGFTEASTPVNKLRNEIYDDVISKVSILDLNQKIYSLNVPTGSGKTLTSVSFALKLRERIIHETGLSPRIVYCLPFMSIIDQNYDVISSVFSSSFGPEIPTDILLKHHHLSDVNYTPSDDEIYNEDVSQLLIEGWNSEFIITTFVQFFHTIISNKNRAIRKFHTLANAIVILDEVQSIPHHYWLLFHDMLQTFARCLNVRVIFVTATQPLIFDESISGEIVELATKKSLYFSLLDRIILTFNNEPRQLPDFILEIQDRIRNESGKDFLIVLNTIKSAEKVYADLSSVSVSNTEYTFLSTQIIPKVRLARIRKIREPDNKSRKVIISTQLIEAGVDIDVDVVYRDMAPLDSINQVAGRCNRNNNQDIPGEVQIVTLMNNGMKYCASIYSQFLLDKTRLILEEKCMIDEQQFLSLNNQYFRLVKELHSDDEAEKCLDMIRYLKYSDLHAAFKLIKNDYPKLDVFVECDATAQKIWQQFVEIKSKPSLERRREFQKIKRQFLDYVISVPEKDAKRLFKDDLGIGYIGHEELEIWYNQKIGFTPSDGGTVFI
jgi:CRISPR-associated endonuclease/helicase Cas3